MRTIDEIDGLLKERGYRSTYSRRKIIEYFLESDGHSTPEMVYEAVNHEGISLPTVYRNLELLRDNGILSELSVSGERLYELRLYSSKEVHLHFKCSACGKLKEYVDSDVVMTLIRMKNDLEDRYADEISGLEIVMNGKCKDCVKNG